ncbi:Riboflavin biosynthesis protein RibF [Anaerohalosphaera lusitana]|uniref:Riboflavin biosynthesis protein n=1 Tax=Anaerohalosphaera lusitana TaxID=1936003 RepID=A0A1U9NNP7_9BACT|nr:bifunctional riboflavin kinase/FAD synthetase [Anaerohalosphaera lusitana]AQT69354.1 Riboflavin biosynthesis protein RibF [Anaerohalosphaera lusitana]
MKIYDSRTALQNLDRTGWALSIGNFDGIHIGHQQILAQARQAANDHNAPGLAVMTFDPHPVAILRPERAPGVLTPLHLKASILESLGVDTLIVIKDSYDLLNLSPTAFVDEFLMRTIKPSVLIEGPNFNFGYGRSGDINTLRELAPDRGFSVIEVPFERFTINHDDRPVNCSSTLIRQLLETGHVKDASRLLTRPYRLIGQVFAGRGIGRKLGYPTANVHPQKQIIPAEGVYAGRVSIAADYASACSADQKLPAVFSIGRAKTFVTDHPLLIEAHLLTDDHPDLYGKYLSLDFVELIRQQQRFPNEDTLKQQIHADCETASKILTLAADS